MDAAGFKKVLLQILREQGDNLNMEDLISELCTEETIILKERNNLIKINHTGQQQLDLVKCLLNRDIQKAVDGLKNVFEKLEMEPALKTLCEFYKPTVAAQGNSAGEPKGTTTTNGESTGAGKLRDLQIAAFNETKPALMNDLEPDGPILTYLCSHHIFTEVDLQDIRNQTNRMKQFDEFAKKIVKRNDTWWDCLIKALKENCQEHLAKQLEDCLARMKENA